MQREPGDPGYYKEVKVGGQRKVGRVLLCLCWGFELNTACNLLFVLFPSIFIFVTVKGNF